VDQYPGTPREGIGVHLERVDAVFERVLGADRVVRQLARLPRWDEARPQLACQRRAEDESARLGRHHVVDLERKGVLRQRCHGGVERGRVQQQRSDVPEYDPLLGKVRDVADVSAQV